MSRDRLNPVPLDLIRAVLGQPRCTVRREPAAGVSQIARLYIDGLDIGRLYYDDTVSAVDIFRSNLADAEVQAIEREMSFASGTALTLSGQWILLHDKRVRIDRPEHTAAEPWLMAECLANLFDAPAVICAGEVEGFGDDWPDET